MIRYTAAQLVRLDARVDRCTLCGGWRFDHWCTTCDNPEKASNDGTTVGAA